MPYVKYYNTFLQLLFDILIILYNIIIPPRIIIVIEVMNMSDNVSCYDFGLRIRELRQNKGLTQEKLAKRLGLTKASISGYENNTAFPPVDVLSRMAIIFGVSSDYLLGIDNRKFILADGLTDSQLQIIENLINEFKNSL